MTDSNSPKFKIRFFGKKMTLRHLLILTPIALAIGSGVTALVLSANADRASAVESNADDQRSLHVATVTAQRLDQLEQATEFTGQVRATRVADLGFEREGRVAEVLVDDGQRIQQGDPVARLDVKLLNSERKQLQAQHQAAIARWEELKNGPRKETVDAVRASVEALGALSRLADASRQRKSGLTDSRAISREEYDASRFAAEAAAARVREAEFQLLELERGTRVEKQDAQKAIVEQLAAAVEEVDTHLEKSTLRAPFDGIVQRRFLDEGTTVSTGRAVISLQEADRLEAWIGVTADVADQLNPEDDYQIFVGEHAVSAKLKTLLPVVSSATRTQTAIFDLTQAGQVVPGRIATLHHKQARAIAGYWLPQNALVSSGRGLWSAMVVEPNDRIGRREVEILRVENDRVYVRGTLSDGDTVVADGVHKLVVGQTVRTAK